MKKIITFLLILSVSLLYAQDNDEEQGRPDLPAGYGDVNWGDRLSTARDNIKGRLTYTDEQTVIIARDGEIVYHYGFFYVDPVEFPPADEENGENEVEAAENDEFFDEGELFFVKLNFPYLSRKDVEQKIVERYGPPTFEDIRNDEGALAWDSEQTVIVMWIDTYEDEPFCRRITYMSKEIAQRLNQHQQRVFHRTELEILERLEP